MKRPQSAKPGYRANWAQGSQSDFQQQDNFSRAVQRKNVKLMKPDLTTNDFARILPKKIYQDKERLYSQALQLKQNLNQTLEENIRLKTRITILQKEKDKLTKHLQLNRDPQSMNKANSRKENMMIRNLKKLVREGKEQNEFLKQQNTKIKKAIKYTKINELEIQRKMLQEENRRVIGLLEEMNGQLANQDKAEREIHELSRQVQMRDEANRQLYQENQKFIQQREYLQAKMVQEAEKAQNKENKLQRELALTKRKLNEANRFVEDLKRELNSLKMQQQTNTKSNNTTGFKPQSIVTKADSQRPKLARPVSSNPYKSNGVVGVRLHTQTKKQEENKENQKIKLVQLQNQQLKEELTKTKIRLQQTQREAKKQNQAQINQQHNEKNQKQKPAKQHTKPMGESNNNNANTSKAEQKKVEKQQKTTKLQNKDDQYYDQEDEYAEDNYQNQFDTTNNNQKQSPQKPSSTHSKPREPTQLDQYRKDFQAEEEEQPLYVKEESPQKNKKLTEQSKRSQNSKKQPKEDKKKKDKKQNAAYKPDKKILQEIKDLLTYRMKAQRYPYEQLKRDIEQAKEKRFSLTDLKGMFINEPFYLTQAYADTLIQYCCESEKPSESQSVSSQVLLAKLRKVVDNFTLVEQKEEEQMLLRIAEMVTEYPDELQTAFEKIKNGEETVAKPDLIEMFQNLQLEAKYIELIIQELSLCSADLEHLNFVGFFERFYVENLSGIQNGQIDQEQMESSSEEVSRNLKSRDNKKLNQIKAEFQDNDENMAVDEGEKISLGNQDYNDANIVSDDEPI